MSVSTTSSPASAQTWAMPRPIWPAPMTPMRLSSVTCWRFRQLGVELGHDLEQIADQAVIGDLEDRRLLVLVDGDDDLRILHAGEMLDRARDADRDVELGRDDLAGLADLVVVGHEAGIDRGARGADRGAELVGDRLQQVEIVARLHAAPARDDDPGAGQLRPLGFRQLGADEFARGRPSRRRSPPRSAPSRPRPRAGGKAVPRTVMILIAVLRLHGRQRVAGIDRPHEGIGRDDAADVGDLHHVEQRGDARHQILALRRRRRQHVRIVRRRGRPAAARHSRRARGRRPRRRRAAPWRRRRSWPRPRRRRGNPRRRRGCGCRRRRPCASSAAAATALRVAGLTALLSCSATTRTVIRSPSPRS